ncbi:hypothetical protein VP1G_11281 [Cytospora mali]|uniref:Uncharacterized protein n=1 Tax=Cytospora mali TaxID=578113 RepID=A0A194VB61_CYTMA|nr:hypothetical protein VP1G_11281 [Valsa mali var. pyri (nom. inval.)]
MCGTTWLEHSQCQHSERVYRLGKYGTTDPEVSWSLLNRAVSRAGANQSGESNSETDSSKIS